MDENEIEKIAIIGMAGRFPNAENTSVFWNNLANGIESITTFSDEELLAAGETPDLIQQKNYVKAGTTFADPELFDAPFFQFSPKDAIATDPQHRIFLEACWEALENSGYTPDTYPGAIAVFGGANNNGYAGRFYCHPSNISSVSDRFQVMMGTDPDFLATRVAYKLNLKGPAMTIQTACSTSLVAVHYACLNLLSYQCDMALSGGVCIQLDQGKGYLFQEGMIFSPDGHCRAFDAKAQGTIFGQGVGIVVLKRLSEALSDGDSIRAVITSSAINNDGSAKVGFTAPGVDGQAEVISLTQSVGEVNAEHISYIETHGTGTPLGDTIEIEALTKAFRTTTDKKSFCAIGSVKTNIGHLDTAAGIAGLIKTVLALQHKQIPPSLHFSTPNPNIDFAGSPFYVNNKLKEWESHGHLRRAGVSSFGIGGTNAHVLLEESPPLASSEKSRPWQLLLLSARTETALNTMTVNLADHLSGNTGQHLPDVAYTLQVGRKKFKHRRIAVCKTTQNAASVLRTMAGDRISTAITEPANKDVIFMFSGQGAQYVNMTLGLYETEPYFREQIDSCAERLQRDSGLNLLDILFAPEEKSTEAKKQLDQTCFTQPALFSVEYALARLWMHWGISPAAMVGHSIGEYVAACLAGVFSLNDALRLVVIRGRLMQSLPPGSMLAVSLSEKDIKPYLSPDLSLAVINSASHCVVSGKIDTVERLEKKLTEQKVKSHILRTSHAFHSPMMDPILDEFSAEVQKVSRNSPRIPFVSNVSGSWITDKEATDPGYWARHLRQAVRFFSCTQTLLDTPHKILLEVGPGQTLNFLTRQHPAVNKEHIILASTRHPAEEKDDVEVLLHTLGQLWLAGLEIDWQHFYDREKRFRIPLPTYPFERKRYWPAERSEERSTDHHSKSDNSFSLSHPEDATKTDPVPQPSREDAPNTAGGPVSAIDELVSGIWKDLLVDVEEITPEDNFFDLGGESLQAVQMFSELEKKTGINLPLGTLFEAPTLGQLVEVFKRRVPTAKQPTQLDTRKTNPWHPLVEIQPQGTEPPFFCVHGVGGNVLNYFVFTKYLEEQQPLYGLQARGLDGITDPYNDLESMATCYIEAIRTIQPHGPYFLGGGSLGGMVALEMAQQLKKEGEQIALLVMFDTQGPKALLTPSHMTLPARSAVSQSFQKYINKLAKLSKKKKIYTLAHSISCRLQERIRNLKCAGFRLLHKPIPHHLRYWYIERANQAAWLRYTPKYYTGTITLFRARGDHNSDGYDPAHGWQEMADGLEIIEMPGTHATFIEQAALGEQLNICLQKSRKECLKTSTA